MMDTSKDLYAGHDIEMIRKAVEVQELWEYKCGDWTWGKVDKRLMVLTSSNKDNSNCIKHQRDKSRDCTFVYVAFPEAYSPNHDTKLKDLLFWLPRQDQLLKIFYPLDHQIIYQRDNKIEIWYQNYNKCEVTILADSEEQGLLRAGMDNKFNKTWNGKNWIKK